MAKMNVNAFLQKDYENVPLRRRGENKPKQTQFQRQKKAGSLEPDVHLCSDYSIWGLVVLCFPGKDEGEKALALGKTAVYVHFCMNSMHETDLCGKATVSVLSSKPMFLRVIRPICPSSSGSGTSLRRP